MLHTKPNLQALLLVTLLASTLFIAACGQTGDLYLPGEDESQEAEPKKSKT